MTTFAAAARRRGLHNVRLVGDLFKGSVVATSLPDSLPPVTGMAAAMVPALSEIQVRKILEHFAYVYDTPAFGHIKFDYWKDVAAINARSFIDGGNRYVVIYGGLINATLMDEFALRLAVAHETAHHLAPTHSVPAAERPNNPMIRRDPLSELSYESDCDYWAGLTGFASVFDEDGSTPLPEPPKDAGGTVITLQKLIAAADDLYRIETGDNPASANCGGGAELIKQKHPEPGCRLALFKHGGQQKLRDGSTPP